MKNEKLLVVQVMEGNSRAFATLLESVTPLARRLICKHVQNLDDVDDVFQNTALKAWNWMIAGKYKQQQGNKFNAWFLTIARNESINILRERKKAPTRVASFIGFEPESYSEPDKNIYQQEAENFWQKILSQLNHTQQMVIYARVEEEKSFYQIAEESRIKSSTLRGTVRRARSKMLIMLNS